MQITVIDALLRGETVTAAATAAKVDRSTVYRWFHDDYAFQAAHNRSRNELWDAINGKLFQIAAAAAETVLRAVEQGDVHAALGVLKGIGALSGTGPTLGADDPEWLEKAAESRRFDESLGLHSF